MDRAEIIAVIQHEQRRIQLPGWRRPRPWVALPERVRQECTEDGMDLVEALEAAGWRLVSTQAEGRHVAMEDASTPPTGVFPVPNMVR